MVVTRYCVIICEIFLNQTQILKVFSVLVACVLFQGAAYSTQHIVKEFVQPVSYFIGRENVLEEINQKLELYGQVALVGPSGIGKTQVARMYAAQNQSRYDIIFFFNHNNALEAQFASLAKKINITTGEQISFHGDVRQNVMNYLTNKKRWLLVFDNITINQNNSILADIINWEHNGNIIFCTQDGGNLFSKIRINYFDDSESQLLIEKVANVDKNTSEELVRNLRGYPVLIAKAANLIKNKEFTAASYYSKENLWSVTKYVQLALGQFVYTTRALAEKIALIDNHKFTRTFLSNITSSPATLDDDVNHMIRFGLIDKTASDSTDEVYEMHDSIKNSILHLLSDSVIRNNINDIMDKLTDWLRECIITQYGYFSGPYRVLHKNYIRHNIKYLLTNAKKYNCDIFRIAAMNQFLFFYYAYVGNIQESRTFFDFMNTKLWKRSLHTEGDKKIFYANYLSTAGFFSVNYYNDVNLALDYLNDAEDMVGDADTKLALFTKRIIFYNSVFVYLNIGDLDKVVWYLNKIDNMSVLQLATPVGTRYRTAYLWALLYEMQGSFEEALKRVNLCADKDTSVDILILKSKILNHLGKFKESHAISNQLLEPNKNNPHIFPEILHNLAKSAFGLQDLSMAKKHIREAKDVLMLSQYLNNKNKTLCNILKIEADILFIDKKFPESLIRYNEAISIYQNELFHQNARKVYHFAEALLGGIKAAHMARNLRMYKIYKDEFIRSFGLKHPLMKDIP